MKRKRHTTTRKGGKEEKERNISWGRGAVNSFFFIIRVENKSLDWVVVYLAPLLQATVNRGEFGDDLR